MKWCDYILKWGGWHVCNAVELPERCVICLAPHTSNWDFVWGNLFGISMGTDAHFFIKKEWMRWPFGRWIKRLGGIGVDRDGAHSLTDVVAERMKEEQRFRLVVTPEGTRRFNPDWKRGFYYIAQKAGVAIVVAVLDYGKREMGYKGIVMPSGDYERDIEVIKGFYSGAIGHHPSDFGL